MCLTEIDLKHFSVYGYVKIKNAFTKETAFCCKDILWQVLQDKHNIRRDHDTWTKKATLDNVYHGSEGKPWSDVFTSTLSESINKICGLNRVGNFGCGWWMITFPESKDDGWKVDGSWHIDGLFRHYPFSQQIGLIPIMFFSDVLPNGGGTAVAESSHLVAAKILSQAGLKGMTGKDLTKTVLATGENFNIIELTGEAGDVVLMHPLLVHARSTNLSPKDEQFVRFMCHPSVRLLEPINFNKSYHEYTVLEKSYLLGINYDEPYLYHKIIENIQSNNEMKQNKNDMNKNKYENLENEKEMKECRKEADDGECSAEENEDIATLIVNQNYHDFLRITPEACELFDRRCESKRKGVGGKEEALGEAEGRDVQSAESGMWEGSNQPSSSGLQYVSETMGFVQFKVRKRY